MNLSTINAPATAFPFAGNAGGDFDLQLCVLLDKEGELVRYAVISKLWKNRIEAYSANLKKEVLVKLQKLAGRAQKSHGIDSMDHKVVMLLLRLPCFSRSTLFLSKDGEKVGKVVKKWIDNPAVPENEVDSIVDSLREEKEDTYESELEESWKFFSFGKFDEIRFFGRGIDYKEKIAFVEKWIAMLPENNEYSERQKIGVILCVLLEDKTDSKAFDSALEFVLEDENKRENGSETLFDFLCKAGELEKAKSLLSSSLVSGFIEDGVDQFTRALCKFGEIQQAEDLTKSYPDWRTDYCTRDVIKAWAKVGGFDKAELLLSELTKCHGDSETMSFVSISMSEKGEFTRAEKLVADLRKEAIRCSSTSTYLRPEFSYDKALIKLIKYLAKAGHIKKAWALFGDIFYDASKDNAKRKIIKALCKIGEIETAISLAWQLEPKYWRNDNVIMMVFGELVKLGYEYRCWPLLKQLSNDKLFSLFKGLMDRDKVLIADCVIRLTSFTDEERLFFDRMMTKITKEIPYYAFKMALLKVKIFCARVFYYFRSFFHRSYFLQ
jgi:tetratricopeptide (TPR) repeat protein